MSPKENSIRYANKRPSPLDYKNKINEIRADDPSNSMQANIVTGTL